MISSGNILVFDIDKVSLLDINELIDKGRRFTLATGLPESEYDSLEEEVTNRCTINSPM